jgi:hypothetical protein
MKLSQSRRGFLLAAFAGACLLPSSISNAANVIIGSGPDTSYLVLQSTNLGIRTYEINYTFGSSAAQDGYFLLSQVLGSVPTLTAALTNYGSAATPNYFVSQFSFNSITEGSAGPNYWAQWVSGGAAGYPSASPIASGTWTSGSGMSAPSRLIAPGSWDAFYFSDGRTAPSVSPVPETSSALLAVLGSFVIFRRRRNA